MTLISDMVKHSLFTNTDTCEYFTRMFIDVAEGYGDSLEMSRGENFLGMVAYVRGHNEVAIKHYLKAIPQFEKAEDWQMVGILRNNVAAAYSYRKKHQETVEQYEEALKVFTELKDTLWIASVTYNLANEYHNLGNMDKSESMHNSSRDLFRYLGDSTYLGYSYLGLGNIALQKGELQKALAYFNRSAELTDPEFDLLTFANIDGSRCKVCTALEKFKLAEFYCKSGIEVSKSAGGYYNLANSYSNFYKLEEARGNYKLALQYSDSMRVYQDSLSNQEKDADILEMVAKFESDQKEQALQINKIQLQASERRNKLFLVGLILLGLLVAIGITLVVQTIRNNKKLAVKNNLINKTLQEKEVLLKEIHHRVK
ncbi:MAG: tetratricopeptide repeat protein, partial [Flavobacteriales bacterium]